MSSIDWPHIEMLVRVFFTGKHLMERAECERPGRQWRHDDAPIEMMGDALRGLAVIADRTAGLDAATMMHVGGGFHVATTAEHDQVWSQVKLLQGRCEAAIGKDPLWPLIVATGRQVALLRMVGRGMRPGPENGDVYFDRLTAKELEVTREASAVRYIRTVAASLLGTMRDVMLPAQIIPPDSAVAEALNTHAENSIATATEVARAAGILKDAPVDGDATLPAMVELGDMVLLLLAAYERPQQSGEAGRVVHERPEGDRLLTIEECAEIARVSDKTIYRHMQNGLPFCAPGGGNRRIWKSDLLMFLSKMWECHSHTETPRDTVGQVQ